LAARDRLIPLVYAELHRCAAALIRREDRRFNLQPAELVHEAYLRLARERRAFWLCRGQFLAVASGHMRRILIDRARARRAQKRTVARARMTTGASAAGLRPAGVEMLDLRAALARLAPRQRRIVELRFFAGLSLGEAGSVMGLSIATVEREWQQARAWLFRALRTARPTRTTPPKQRCNQVRHGTSRVLAPGVIAAPQPPGRPAASRPG
jgi:RNA polymerase sigma factor (TIGR02999 family)